MRNNEILATIAMIEKLRNMGFRVEAPAPTRRTVAENQPRRWTIAQKKRASLAAKRRWAQRKKA